MAIFNSYVSHYQRVNQPNDLVRQVDLAGSERASRTGAEGSTLKLGPMWPVWPICGTDVGVGCWVNKEERGLV